MTQSITIPTSRGEVIATIEPEGTIYMVGEQPHPTFDQLEVIDPVFTWTASVQRLTFLGRHEDAKEAKARLDREIDSRARQEVAEAKAAVDQAKAEAQRLRDEAERQRRREEHPGCLVISVVDEADCGVGYCAYGIWVESGEPIPRASDEGMDIHGADTAAFRLAVLEAEERARRAAPASKIGREGYTLADYREAVKWLGR